MKNLRLEVLAEFAEAQAVARGITSEKEGNVRAHYLEVKRADNAERWKDTAASQAKRDARNARRRELYTPKPPKTEPNPEEVRARSRAKWAKAKASVNAARRAKYSPEARSDRHKRTGH